MNKMTLIAVIVAALISGGCATTTAPQPLPARQIYADGLCGRTETDAAARWIADASELEIVRRQFGQYRLGPPTLPAVDFRRRGVLLVLMGRRATAGYALALASEQAHLKDGVATVALDWQRPGEDAILAQVLTSPCVMITLPRHGLERIDVVDQTGTRRASVTP